MRELLAPVGFTALVVAGVVVLEAALRARRWRRTAVPVRACDVCDRMTSAREAHTHHHDEGCGIDDPAREYCRCDSWRCPACCPCSIEALLERAHG